MAWTENGPVSTPSNTIVGVVALVIGIAAVGGLGLGFKASFRDASRPARGEIDTQISGQATMAQPIVELPQPQAAPPPTNAAATNAAKAADDSDEIAAKTAAAQAAQSKPAQPPPDIDQMLTSPSEKPQPPAKPSTDESPPSAPKSDVPF
ncbi:MAG TPA: hypothetical protein VFE13_08865 [Caulobacteraceae bacterium]|jgi:outer membrane biosynthesis protein TonB|nr:hypothetical protein [Caulobacteraceae bacterium]